MFQKDKLAKAAYVGLGVVTTLGCVGYSVFFAKSAYNAAVITYGLINDSDKES